jgi:hypothetical protein
MDIISYCNANPREYIYIGIGSKNRTNNLNEFTSDLDQILPCFLNTVTKTIRVIHYDPKFAPEDDNGFLYMYFTSKGFIQIDNVWVTPDFRIEVIIIPEAFTDESLFSEYIKHAINCKSQLVVQAYSGIELASMFRQLYMTFSSADQVYIKDNVLFDITYGTECNCMTPMTQFAPLINNRGTFYNFLLYTREEKLAIIGENPRIDELIVKGINQDLSKILNENSVNYRKAVRGEPLMFEGHYSQDASSEEIMTVMLKQVGNLLDVLDRLKVLTPEKRELFRTCSNNYRTTDMYKWYIEMTNLYKN